MDTPSIFTPSSCPRMLLALTSPLSTWIMLLAIILPSSFFKEDIPATIINTTRATIDVDKDTISEMEFPLRMITSGLLETTITSSNGELTETGTLPSDDTTIRTTIWLAITKLLQLSTPLALLELLDFLTPYRAILTLNALELITLSRPSLRRSLFLEMMLPSPSSSTPFLLTPETSF